MDSESAKKTLKSAFIRLSIIGFAIHLALIACVKIFPELGPRLSEVVGSNFLKAIYTPFSFILFYEVLLLVLSIPKSLSSSICKQYEIISLIVVRRVFKDIGAFEDMDSWLSQPEAVRTVLLDMGSALLMFLSIAAIYRIRRAIVSKPAIRDLDRFIRMKKAIAAILGLVLAGLATFNVVYWLGSEVFKIGSFQPPVSDYDAFFFPSFFEFMIFTDVLILLLSISYYDRYEHLFRNSGFLISTVLLRISLSTPKPYDVAVALTSIIYGLCLISIFAYYSHLAAKDPKSTKIADPENSKSDHDPSAA